MKSEHFADLPLPVKRIVFPDEVKHIQFRMEVTVEFTDGSIRMYSYITGQGWQETGLGVRNEAGE
jgi:hypothetical protein